MNAATPQSPTISAYTEGIDHLHDHLARAAKLYHAQTTRWRYEIAAHKPEHLWGMIQVSDDEISAMMDAPFVRPGALPAGLDDVMAPCWRDAEQLGELIAARTEATSATVDLRLDRLMKALGLSNLERDALLLSLLPELDVRYRRLVGYLLDDATRTRPTLDLIIQLLHPVIPNLAAGRALFAPDAPLLAQHLIRLGENGHTGDALAEGAVILEPRIAAFLLGDDALDRRLRGAAETISDAPPLSELIMDADRLDRARALPAWLHERNELRQGTIIYLQGANGSGRLAMASAISTAQKRPLLVVPVSRLSNVSSDWDLIIDLAFREAKLADCDIFWSGVDAIREIRATETNGTLSRWEQLLARVVDQPLTTWIAGSTPWYPTNAEMARQFLHLDFPPPTIELRERLWRRHLPKRDAFAGTGPKLDKLIHLLVNGFQLNGGQIIDAIHLAHGFAIRRSPGKPRLTVEDIYEACRRQAGSGLSRLARRVEPVGDMNFDDLTLRPDSRRQIDDLRARIRLRTEVYGGLGFGRGGTGGFVALFTGTSGTGKTMAAQLLAKEHGVDLYKIDLSQIVSKYVGETEKNLERIFSEAEDANAILFFDEADSLFGKRGDVKEARDRWANLEVNYLLQRVEEFSGVVILATNLRQNIDQAFLRRIHTIVEFPFPDAKARERIWNGMFPPGIKAPNGKTIASLAERFELPGGGIRNVAIDAAFRALADSSTEGETPDITERHLIVSICREYLKIGKPVTPAEFGSHYYDMVAGDILGRSG